MRRYHIVAISERTGDQFFMTRYPMDHDQACNMLRRFTQHKGRRLQLVEALT